ncbi:hypothetical protein JW916_16430, partial [Candidatus Sumerlaeota bacterium]|nr:hypothetical protein [Candidatus Sumerlaeota bacterium]
MPFRAHAPNGPGDSVARQNGQKPQSNDGIHYRARFRKVGVGARHDLVETRHCLLGLYYYLPESSKAATISDRPRGPSPRPSPRG